MKADKKRSVGMQPQLVVQSLTGTRAQILVAFLLAGHAMDVDELMSWTGKDRKTHYPALKALCGAGHLEPMRYAHGRVVYYLGSEVLPLLRKSAAQLRGMDELEGGQESAFRTPGMLIEGGGQESAFRTPGGGQESAFRTSGAQESVNPTSALEEEEVILKDSIKDIDSSSAIQESALRTSGITARRLLECSGKLFGSPGVVLSGLDVDELPALWVAAWLASAYDQWRDGNGNGNLKSPGSFVWKKLQSRESPPGEMVREWRVLLPASWLERLGLASYVCGMCGVVHRELVDHDAHVLSAHPVCEKCGEQWQDVESLARHMAEHLRVSVVNPIVDVVWNDTTSPLKAWQTVQSQLELELKRHTFDSWVRDTQVIDFNGQVLTVAVRNMYTRDWLVNRLESTVNRMLVGVMNGDVVVDFVVSEGVSGD